MVNSGIFRFDIFMHVIMPLVNIKGTVFLKRSWITIIDNFCSVSIGLGLDNLHSLVSVSSTFKMQILVESWSRQLSKCKVSVSTSLIFSIPTVED